MRLLRASIRRLRLRARRWSTSRVTDHAARGPEASPLRDVFDPAWYLEEYPDVAAAGVDPFDHYLRSGRGEGRRPCAWFDPAWYAEEYPFAVARGLDPLDDFLRFGRDEGRKPCAWFDPAWYVSAYPDVAGAGLEPIDHYLRVGRSEGRLPNRNAVLDRWVGRFAAVELPAPQDPAVSIIILNFNGSEMVLECIASIIDHTDLSDCEVIVVDNGSADADLRLLTALPDGVKLIRVGANRFFGEGNNIGAEESRGKLLCFMNNDVVVTPGWLDSLRDGMDSDDRVRACGPLFRYPDGRIQEAGASVAPDGRAVQHGKGEAELPVEFRVARAVDYVSAATLLIDAQSFFQSGGFSQMYEPAYYEDTHLCREVRARGGIVLFCPEAVVIHQESATTTGGKHGLKLDDIVEINRLKYLRAEQGGSAVFERLPAVATSRPRGPRTVIYTPYPLYPGGGEKYILSVARSAAALSHDVILWTPHRYSQTRVQQVQRALGIEEIPLSLHYGMRAPDAVDNFLLMANEVLPPMQGIGRRNLYHCQFPFDLQDGAIFERWDNLPTFDEVIVNSDFTAEAYVDASRQIRASAPPIRVVHPPCDTFAPGSKRELILSVGRFSPSGHAKNHHLLIPAFRELAEATGDAELELLLIGSLGPAREDRDYYNHCVRMAEGLNVRVVADASRAELADALAQAKVYWHAAGARAGSSEPWKQEHFGISVVEAMGAGAVPVVYADGGPSRIVQDRVSGLLWRSHEELVLGTAELLADERQRQALAERAMEQSVAFTTAAFDRNWQAILDGTAPSQGSPRSARSFLSDRAPASGRR